MNIAKAASALSKDSSKIGAIALAGDRIVSVGINGYPAGYDDNDHEGRYEKVIHAEINVILNYAGDAKDIDTLFIYGLAPCPECMKFMATLGINTVYFMLDNNIKSCNIWTKKHIESRSLHKNISFIEIVRRPDCKYSPTPNYIVELYENGRLIDGETEMAVVPRNRTQMVD